MGSLYNPQRRHRRAWWTLIAQASVVGCGYVGIDLEPGVGPGPTIGSGASAFNGGSTASDDHRGGGGTAQAEGGRALSGGATSSGGALGPGGEGGSTSSDGGMVAANGGRRGESGGSNGTGGADNNLVASCVTVGAIHEPFERGVAVVENPDVGEWGIDVPNADNTGTLDWNGDVGHLAPGALELTLDRWAGDRQVLTPKLPLNEVDMTNKVIAAHLYVEQGENAFVQVFAFSPGDNSWTDSEPTQLPVGEWTCATLDMANPFYGESDFNPQRVEAIGVQVFRDKNSRRDGALVVYLDDVSY